MRRVVFNGDSLAHFTDWARDDKKLFQKIAKLIEECRREPFEGTGKPEPLKHDYKGCWSRRISDEHRLVYKITNEELLIYSCKYHYQ